MRCRGLVIRLRGVAILAGVWTVAALCSPAVEQRPRELRSGRAGAVQQRIARVCAIRHAGDDCTRGMWLRSHKGGDQDDILTVTLRTWDWHSTSALVVVVGADGDGLP